MRFVLLLVAAVVAVIAGVLVLNMSGKNATPANAGPTPVVQSNDRTNVDTVDVLVAKEPIAMGTLIKNSMIDKQPWPKHLVLETFIVSDGKGGDNIEGRVARSNFVAHEPILSNKIANPNDPSFLAATLPAGMRAVTLATDAISGVAGYVFPGDRVDVLVTHNIPGQVAYRDNPKVVHPGVDKPAFTEVLATNLRVLAVNVRLPAGKEASQENPTPSSITVESDPVAAQKIRLSEKLGTLSVVLRSIKDKDNHSLPSPTNMDSLTRLQAAEATNAPTGVKIVRGAGKDADNAADSQAGSAYAVSGEPSPSGDKTFIVNGSSTGTPLPPSPQAN